MANLAKPGKLKHDEITRLIDIDSGEEFDHGQSVRNTFPQCDFFLRVDHAVVGPSEAKAIAQINERVRRFFDLILGLLLSPHCRRNGDVCSYIGSA